MLTYEERARPYVYPYLPAVPGLSAGQAIHDGKPRGGKDRSRDDASAKKNLVT